MRFLLLLCLFGFTICHSQNTLQLEEGQTSPKANLEDVSWIQGYWQGEAFGGVAEEIWSPPMGESMMFVFRLVNDNKVSFYEIGHIKQVASTLLMQLKHFHGDLKGWEKKDETVDFKLVKLEKDMVFFEGLTMERVNENQIRVYVLVDAEGKSEEVLFEYRRIKI